MPEPKDRPRYRVYRGGDDGDPGADEALERIRRLGAGPVADPPAGAPPQRPGSPIVLPEPGAQPPVPGAPPAPPREPGREPRPGRGIPWQRILKIGIPVALVLLIGWVAFGYWRFAQAVDEANARVTPATRAALTPDTGSLLRNPTNVLLIGEDRRPGQGRGRSDSLMLLHSDPGRGELAWLSIPRDLRVEIPGVGTDKINAAYALGGAPLTIKTVQGLTGLPVNHVALIDFAGFKDLVDALGGVTLDNPTKIISNEFEGYEWRFGRGTLHLDGRHALAYARVRKNQLDASDTDVTRGERQQRVMNAIASGLAKPSTLLRLPTVADAVPGPLTTDLKGRQLLALGWRKQRASRELHCRLGGTPALGSYLIGSEENRQVVAMVLGRSAPQPPRKGDPFAPGCTVS